MDAKEYQELAARTLLESPEQEIADNELMIIWNAIGLAGEAGEVAELAKKAVFHKHGIDKEKFANELGDCLWYISAMCTTLNLDLSEIMQANIAKLKTRYPKGYSSEASKKRVDLED